MRSSAPLFEERSRRKTITSVDERRLPGGRLEVFWNLLGNLPPGCVVAASSRLLPDSCADAAHVVVRYLGDRPLAVGDPGGSYEKNIVNDQPRISGESAASLQWSATCTRAWPAEKPSSLRTPVVNYVPHREL